MAKNSQKILLAEDDHFLKSMYATKLAGENVEVLVASDGQKALELMRKHIPSVALVDILMPKMDGFAVLAEMKKDEALKSIPVIMLTNLSEPEDVSRAKKLGASEYLIKSHFLPAEVINIVQKYTS
ncbi:response regulator [bacterium]|jgi:CheY-like chemotaxis protein|nr:response regulator [bacterium]MDP6571441.1 response regulator [Patescibacteria group bacterium]MDP6756538.1 response regulator [Patescibacteria group bacterium]|tara:strand:+ start:5863 stop:6240 length:378 start_codon:yes stop_codon:yes gene_type:complete